HFKQHAFDFARGNVFPRPADHVLGAAHNIVVPTRTLFEQVAGAKPFAVIRSGHGLWLAIIALHDAGAPDDELAHFTARHVLAVFIDDAEFAMGHGYAAASRTHRVRRAHGHEHPRAYLGHSIAFSREDVEAALQVGGASLGKPVDVRSLDNVVCVRVLFRLLVCQGGNGAEVDLVRPHPAHEAGGALGCCHGARGALI